MSLHADQLLGDPIARIRYSPHYLMLARTYVCSDLDLILPYTYASMHGYAICLGCFFKSQTSLIPTCMNIDPDLHEQVAETSEPICSHK